VRTAAAKLDSLYPTITASYPPMLSPDSKRTIWVSPEPIMSEAMANVYGDTVGAGAIGAVLKIDSPSVNLIPMEISDSDWLAEAVHLRLLELLGEEAVRRHSPHHLRSTQEAVGPLHRLLYSVQLWQVWSTDLPLAALREPVVQWAYSDIPPGERVLPDYQAHLCDLHRLWTGAPLAIYMPLFCGETEEGDPNLKWRYRYFERWRYVYTYPWRLADHPLFSVLTPICLIRLMTYRQWWGWRLSWSTRRQPMGRKALRS
jgi:hypothetical protein